MNPDKIRDESNRPDEIKICGPILIVDDNVDLAASLEMLLRSYGFNAHSVHNGAAALEWMEMNHPAVIFMDLGMPGMDGYEAVRRIHEFPGKDGALLVALSGWGQAEDHRRSLYAF